MSEVFLEDLKPGQIFSSGTVRVGAEEIIAFATQYDPQQFHLSEATAKNTFFRGLAASGWHTAALTMRLLVESDFKPALVGLLVPVWKISVGRGRYVLVMNSKLTSRSSMFEHHGQNLTKESPRLEQRH